MERGIIFPILNSRLTWVLARVAGTFMFWFAGLRLLLDFPAVVEALKAEGYLANPSSIAMMIIAVQIVGAALIIHGRYAWIGAAMLAGYTLLAQPRIAEWWSPGISPLGQGGEFGALPSAESLTIIGGLIALAILAQLEQRRADPAEREADRKTEGKPG